MPAPVVVATYPGDSNTVPAYDIPAVDVLAGDLLLLVINGLGAGPVAASHAGTALPLVETGPPVLVNGTGPSNQYLHVLYAIADTARSGIIDVGGTTGSNVIEVAAVVRGADPADPVRSRVIATLAAVGTANLVTIPAAVDDLLLACCSYIWMNADAGNAPGTPRAPGVSIRTHLLAEPAGQGDGALNLMSAPGAAPSVQLGVDYAVNRTGFALGLAIKPPAGGPDPRGMVTRQRLSLKGRRW